MVPLYSPSLHRILIFRAAGVLRPQKIPSVFRISRSSSASPWHSQWEAVRGSLHRLRLVLPRFLSLCVQAVSEVGEGKLANCRQDGQKLAIDNPYVLECDIHDGKSGALRCSCPVG